MAVSLFVALIVLTSPDTSSPVADEDLARAERRNHVNPLAKSAEEKKPNEEKLAVAQIWEWPGDRLWRRRSCAGVDFFGAGGVEDRNDCGATRFAFVRAGQAQDA